MEEKKKDGGKDEKKNPIGKEQPPSESNKTLYNEKESGLSKEDLPESTNESTGKMGSGQRQDSN
jgi:hypothetical protein